MANVTQKTEYPATYEQSFEAVKKQMMKNSKITKKYTEPQINLKIKKALMDKARDKIEFSLRGEIRRGRHIKMGISEEDFSKEWKTKMRTRLQKDGFIFSFTPIEQKMLKDMQSKEREEAVVEASKIASEALKGVFSSIK